MTSPSSNVSPTFCITNTQMRNYQSSQSLLGHDQFNLNQLPLPTSRNSHSRRTQLGNNHWWMRSLMRSCSVRKFVSKALCSSSSIGKCLFNSNWDMRVSVRMSLAPVIVVLKELLSALFHCFPLCSDICQAFSHAFYLLQNPLSETHRDLEMPLLDPSSLLNLYCHRRTNDPLQKCKSLGLQ